MASAYRSTAISALKDYQAASLIPSLDSIVSWLDSRYGSEWLGLWGEAVSRVNRTELARELRILAKLNGMSFPSRPDLNDAIFKVGGTIDKTKVVKEALAQTVTDVNRVFSIGVGAAIAIGVLYFAFMSGVFTRAKK